MPPAGFEPAIPTSERVQTHAVDRAATGTVPYNYTLTNYSSLCVNMVVFKLEVTHEFFLERCVFGGFVSTLGNCCF